MVLPMMSSVSAEEEAIVQDREVSDVRIGMARPDVLHEPGPATGSVRRPELAPVHPVIGAEEQSIVKCPEPEGAGVPSEPGAAGVGVDVPYQLRALPRTVGLPEFDAVGAVVGPEEQHETLRGCQVKGGLHADAVARVIQLDGLGSARAQIALGTAFARGHGARKCDGERGDGE